MIAPRFCTSKMKEKCQQLRQIALFEYGRGKRKCIQIAAATNLSLTTDHCCIGNCVWNLTSGKSRCNICCTVSSDTHRRRKTLMPGLRHWRSKNSQTTSDSENMSVTTVNNIQQIRRWITLQSSVQLQNKRRQKNSKAAKHFSHNFVLLCHSEASYWTLYFSWILMAHSSSSPFIVFFKTDSTTDLLLRWQHQAIYLIFPNI